MIRTRFNEILNNCNGNELQVLAVKQPQYVVINSNNYILDNDIIQILLNYLSKFGIPHLVNHEAACVMFKFDTKQEAYYFRNFIHSKLIKLEESLIKDPIFMSDNWLEATYKEMGHIHSIVTLELNENENHKKQIQEAKENSIEEKMRFNKPSYLDVLNFVHHDLIRYNDESFINEVCEHYMTYTNAFNHYDDVYAVVKNIAEQIKTTDLRNESFELFNLIKPIQMILMHHEDVVKENKDNLKDLISLSKNSFKFNNNVEAFNHHNEENLSKIKMQFDILKYVNEDVHYDFSDHMCALLTPQINNPNVYKHIFDNNKDIADVRHYIIDDIVNVMTQYFAAQNAWNILVSIKRIARNVDNEPLSDFLNLQDKILKV